MDRKKERLEEEQALQLEELEEENRRKRAELELTEMELTDDLTCLKRLTNFVKHCLTLVNTRSKQRRRSKQRWVNEVNEPDSVSHQQHTNTIEFNNVVGSFNTAVNPESTNFVQLRQATVPARYSADVNIGSGQSHIPPIGISSVSTILSPNSTPPSFTAVNPLSFFQPPPAITRTKTVSSVTVPVASQQSLTRFSQVQPSVGPSTTMTQVNIPTSHVIPNLSDLTFPAPSNLPKVHATVPQPVRGQFTLTSTSEAPIVTTTGVSAPVVITIHIPVRTSRILLVRFLFNQSANIFFWKFYTCHKLRALIGRYAS